MAAEAAATRPMAQFDEPRESPPGVSLDYTAFATLMLWPERRCFGLGSGPRELLSRRV